jgi:hypothetical protein
MWSFAQNGTGRELVSGCTLGTDIYFEYMYLLIKPEGWDWLSGRLQSSSRRGGGS